MLYSLCETDTCHRKCQIKQVQVKVRRQVVAAEVVLMLAVVRQALVLLAILLLHRLQPQPQVAKVVVVGVEELGSTAVGTVGRSHQPQTRVPVVTVRGMLLLLSARQTEEEAILLPLARPR